MHATTAAAGIAGVLGSGAAVFGHWAAGLAWDGWQGSVGFGFASGGCLL
jgi:hypothetical protein